MSVSLLQVTSGSSHQLSADVKKMELMHEYLSLSLSLYSSCSFSLSFLSVTSLQ